MKNVMLGLVIAALSFGVGYAGDCDTGCTTCRVPRRVVTLSQEIVQVPVEVTTRTVTRVRRFGRRVFGRRVVVADSCGCNSATETTGEPTPAPAAE